MVYTKVCRRGATATLVSARDARICRSTVQTGGLKSHGTIEVHGKIRLRTDLAMADGVLMYRDLEILVALYTRNEYPGGAHATWNSGGGKRARAGAVPNTEVA